jgi:hypothetical protein
VVGRSANQASAGDARLKRLAQKIEALAAKDATVLQRTREMTELRKAAAAGIHAICAGFVKDVNAHLANCEVDLDPNVYSEAAFDDNSLNLIQINIRGRILQVEFRATPELVSTEDFRIPYTLEGTVRAFNQELLEKDLIEEQLVFFTLEKAGGMWRYFDARTYRSGPLDREYLVLLMEQLI